MKPSTRTAPPRLLPVLLLAAAPLAMAAAEDLRALVAATVTLSPELSDGARFSMAYNESFAVTWPKESPFVQGFEIEIKLPQAAIAMPGALAWEMWRRLDPAPDRNRYGYTGDRLLTQPLPNRASLVLQVPVRKEHNLKSGPYSTVLPLMLEQKDFPFLFRFEAVAKGIPSDLETAQFQVRVRPLLTDEGAVRIALRYPDAGADHGPIAVTVDDRRLPEGRYVDGREALVLKAGTHYLRISSDRYRDENRSFSLEQGRTLDLVIDLQDTAPLVTIEAPDSALLTLDGQKLGKDAKAGMAVEPGEHTVTCRIGDYVVTRKFTAYRGKAYRLVLQVELVVQESP